MRLFEVIVNYSRDGYIDFRQLLITELKTLILGWGKSLSKIELFLVKHNRLVVNLFFINNIRFNELLLPKPFLPESFKQIEIC